MSLSSLGMRLLPGVAIRTVAGGFAPKPSGIRQDSIQQIGTGRARGTGSVGSSGDDGGDNELTPEEYQRQVDYFTNNEFAGVYSPDKQYPKTLAGYLQKSLDYALAPHVEFNKLTQTYRATGPGGLIESAMGPLAAFMALGQKANIANLERIQGKVDAGEKGYGVGLLNNQIVGTSPLPEFLQGTMFDPGYGTFSGMVPETPRGISEAQHLRNLQIALTNAATPLGYDADEIYGPDRSIPDITAAYNLLTYGASEGADFGNIPGGGSVVTSSVPNPLGPGYANINVPVTSGGHSGLPQGYVTTTLSGVSGTDLFNAPPAGPATMEDTGAMSPEDIANTFGGPTPDMGTDFGDDYNDPGPGGGDNNDNNNDGGSSTSASDGIGDAGQGGPGGYGESYGGIFRLGGRVGMRNGGEASPQMGFVNKDPRTVSDSQGIADNRFTSVPEGSFVMNQPANEMHKDDLDVLLGDAEKRAGPAQTNRGMVDVALSDGERLIRPEVVDFVEKKYGGGFLDNINNTGKPEVERREAKYGAKIGKANGGGIRTDRGFLQQAIGPDSPIVTGPTPDKPASLNLTSVSPDDDRFFGYRFGDIKAAIQNVEIKGFEKDPYIFTGIKRKGKASSAFGPMQITATTLKDIKNRSPLYNLLDQGGKEYVDLLIQQGDDKVNIERFGSKYRNKKKVSTPAQVKKSFGKYGKGDIPSDLHETYYETIANITLRQKLKDHKSLKKALASYGEGDSYAQKVLRGLD